MKEKGLITFYCEACGKEKTIGLYQYNKNNNHFCNHSCAVSYNNKHRYKTKV